MIYFVTAIHTASGKTLVSAILAQALQADYWKPVQSGSDRDSDTVKNLLLSEHSIIFNEAYSLKASLSPHAAAQREGKRISLSNILLPENEGNDLIIEGAGGVLAPLNDEEVVIDIAAKFDAEIILVSNHYLGSINHTLLTCNELKRRNLKVKGIVFNGVPNKDTEDIILKKTGYKCLLRILPEEIIDEELVNKYAIQLFDNWND